MVRSLAPFIAVLVVIIQVCTAFFLREGVYEIKNKDGLLTDFDGGDRAPVAIMPKERGDSQRWHVSYEEDDVVSIRSIRSGLYLSIPQAPFPGEVLVVSDNEQRWKVQKTDQDQFFIETMEKFDGTRLMIDEAYGSIYPRLAALDLPRKGGDQAWSFQKVDDNPRYYRRPYRQTGFYHY